LIFDSFLVNLVKDGTEHQVDQSKQSIVPFHTNTGFSTKNEGLNDLVYIQDELKPFLGTETSFFRSCDNQQNLAACQPVP
jgi:hypothetical protein